MDLLNSKSLLLFASFVLLSTLAVQSVEAEDYPQGCTNPAEHGTDEQPHTQENEGHTQCHGENGDDGSCTIGQSNDLTSVSCSSTVFTGRRVEYCSASIECDGQWVGGCPASSSYREVYAGFDDEGNAYVNCIRTDGSSVSASCP